MGALAATSRFIPAGKCAILERGEIRGAFVTLTAAQCRAGRALVDWSRDEMGRQAGVAARTILEFERGARVPRTATKAALRRSLEAAGVIFLDENGEGPGVRLRK